MKTLLLIDGFNHVFRAYHAMQRLGLETFDGMPTGAVANEILHGARARDGDVA